MGLAALVLIALPVALLAACVLYVGRIGRDLLRVIEHLDGLIRFLLVGADADDR